MDDTFAESKTQWLNDTLKFIKNDQELILKYPEWPITRVKFYHALIAQRQLNAGLGFKTLYAPLWEAMKVFGLKYNFKVTIVNSKDEEKGSLVLEKIPKKTEDTETDSEEESTCKHKLTKKMEQAYILNKAIVERNSPTFIKNTLKSFLGFIIDEESASIDFKDLAPIEAKFIENILAIHDQKVLFYKIFSPSAIEILKKISTSLSLYKNTYNIKVGTVRTNPKTAKREITLIKEPNFGNPSYRLPSTTSSKSSTKKKSKSKPMSPAPLRTPKSINPQQIPSFECASSSVSDVDASKTKPKELDKKILNCKVEKEKQHANDKETLDYKTGRQAKSRLINVEDISNHNNKTGKENSPSNANQNVNNKIDCKVNVKNEKEKIMRPENEGKSTKVPEKTQVKVKVPAPADSNSKPALSRSGQKRAMLEAMSKPLESDKGLRMMKLMGWEGGALGLRGDGIMEPITPALHLKPKAGLGAPPVKSSNKENKTETKTKKGTKESKSGLMRFQFLEGAYEALDKGDSIIYFKSSLNTKEVTLYINNILQLNRRARVSHNCQSEKNMVDKILEKLHKMPDKMFDYSFMHNASELYLKVINKTDGVSMPQPIAPKAGTKTELPDKLLEIDNYLRSTTGRDNLLGVKRKKASVSKLSVKLYTLLMVAYFVESDDIDMNMDFSFGYCKKVFKYMQRICVVLNEGKQTKKIKSAEEVELLNEISASLKSSFLSVHLFSPQVSVRKLKLSSKHRQIIDYNQFFNIPPNDKSNNESDASDSELDDENKAKIDKSVQKLITKPSNGKKLDKAINYKAKIDDGLQKLITEPSSDKKREIEINCKAKIDDSIHKLITESSNDKKLEVAINCKAKIDDSIHNPITKPSNDKKLEVTMNSKAKIDDSIQKLIMDPSDDMKLDETINCKAKTDESMQKRITEPSNSKELNEAINLNKNVKQLHENLNIDTNKFNFIIKNITEDTLYDMDKKVNEKRLENFGQQSRSDIKPIEIDDKNTKDEFIDLIQKDLKNKDFNDNVLNSDIPSEIKSTGQSCDTNSLKNNNKIVDEVQKDSIDVLEYKEYSIVKIMLQDWEDLQNLSRRIQECIMNYDYSYEYNYLKCHGIQNGGLVYYCSNEDRFKDILDKSFNANYKLETIEKFKIKVHINSFIRVRDVLKALELHNKGLYTTDWTVLEEGNCYFIVDVDYDSFQFVCSQRFSLFAGVDTALITIIL